LHTKELISNNCFFVSDLHGSISRYKTLFDAIMNESPAAVFMGGDLLPSGMMKLTVSFKSIHKDFINDFLAVEFGQLKKIMGEKYPEIFLILGNDDPRFEESSILSVSTSGIWNYIHNRKIIWNEYSIYGYSFIPPTPFRLKDWEKFDVSRYTDPGCTAPYEGSHTIPVSESELKYSTIKDDLKKLTMSDNLEKAIFLFHSPPYQTYLDRAALDNKMIDYVPLDVHVGSIAIKRFIERNQPLLTLHGHVHESTRITGNWKDSINKTTMLSAAYDGKELALVRFDPESPQQATREII